MASIDDKQALCVDQEPVRHPPQSPPPPYQESSPPHSSSAPSHGYDAHSSSYPCQGYDSHSSSYPSHGYGDRRPPQPVVVQFQQCHQPQTVPYDLSQVNVVPFKDFARPDKSLSFTVVMCVTICGLLGMHHFYLDRMAMGYMYAFTCGLFGIGWVVDWFRVPSLVRKRNAELREAKERGHWLHHSQRYGRLTKRSLVDAYLMWLPPFGLFGAHHFYIGRPHYALFHAATFGLHVVGWVVDLFRMPYLVRRANQDIEKLKTGRPLEQARYSLMDAYLLTIPLGFLGLHHFYLGNHRRGVLFLCTLGIFGLGWFADLFQLPMIVAEANKRRQQQQRLAAALNHQQHGNTTTTVIVMRPPDVQNQQHVAGNTQGPPPAYMPQHAAGAMVETVHAPPRPQVATTYSATNDSFATLPEPRIDQSSTTSTEKKTDFIDAYCR